MKRMKGLLTLTLCFLLSSCPSTNQNKAEVSRLGERSDYDNTRGGTSALVEAGEVPSTSALGRALNDSLSAPDKSCTDCGMEEPTVFQNGSFSDRLS